MTFDLKKLKEIENQYEKYLKDRSEIVDRIIQKLIAINGGKEKYEFSYGGNVILSSMLEVEHHDKESTIKQILADMRKSSSDDFEKQQNSIRESQTRQNNYSQDNPYYKL